MNTKKEYIKNFIIRSIKGKVDQTEVQQIRDRLMNYSREDWRDLIIVGKELMKEAIDEQIESGKVPSDWKEIIRDFSISMVNFTFAVLDEEVIYQSMLLEKQGGLDQQTKIIKILPAVSHSIDRMVARAPSRSFNGNWKADKSLTAKFKKVVKEFQGFQFRLFLSGGKLDEEVIKRKVSKVIGIFESLTPEEIAILKGKAKIFINSCLDDYAPPQIKNSPEIRQFINSFINLMDAVGDEKLIKDSISILAKVLKLAIQNEQALKGKGFVTTLRATGTETEVKSLIQSLTQHLNKLAGEGEKNSLSTEKEESIIQRLTEGSSSPQPGNQEDTNLKDIWKNNLITNGLETSDSLKNLTYEDLNGKFRSVFLNTQIKPKWYQNPWIIWPIAGVALVVGGLIIWWLVGRKKEKKR